MIRICAVDITDQKVVAMLQYLQLDALPMDLPYEVAGAHWWVAYYCDVPVAFAGVTQSTTWIDTGYLCRAGVVRSHRGLGLQKRLIRVRERKARALGWRYLITDTTPANAPSANSLISCGYRIYVPEKPWGLAGAVYWRKKIEKGVPDGIEGK